MARPINKGGKKQNKIIVGTKRPRSDDNNSTRNKKISGIVIHFVRYDKDVVNGRKKKSVIN